MHLFEKIVNHWIALGNTCFDEVGRVWVQLLGGQGTPNRVSLVLRGCILNATAVSLVLPAFDVTDSLGSSRRMVYSYGSTLGDYFPIPFLF